LDGEPDSFYELYVAASDGASLGPVLDFGLEQVAGLMPTITPAPDDTVDSSGHR